MEGKGARKIVQGSGSELSEFDQSMKIENDINALVPRSELSEFDQSMEIESDINALVPRF